MFNRGRATREMILDRIGAALGKPRPHPKLPHRDKKSDPRLRNERTLIGGVHPNPRKHTQDLETVVMPMPGRLILPMQQHIGAPCEVLVKKGDQVYLGQMIGRPTDRLSCPIHASASGVVTAVEAMPHAGGREVLSVEIKPDAKQTVDPSIQAVETRDPEEMKEAVRQSGLVGLGGAGFPTWFKLTPPKGQNFDLLLINGAECEPYITSDYREMVENPLGIIEGIKLVQQMTGIREVRIGVEDNKARAIDRLIQASLQDPEIDVVELKTVYPQGGEKQLIYALSGRVVQSGQLPSTVGVLVLSINTVAFIANYFATGMPLVTRRITCDGGAVRKPQNVVVPIGTRLEDVFEFCGGFNTHPERVIMGGPMMGVNQYSLDNAVLKQTNALLALDKSEVNQEPERHCIRCARCVAACPMKLMPCTINELVLQGKIDEAANRYHLMDCMECGCCSYICPASRKLVQSFRYGKGQLRNRKLREAAAISREVDA